MLILWIIIFIISLIVLVKGADWLISSAEKIGLAFGLSPFIVGVTIVGIGTSAPELVSSLAAVFRGVTDVVVANAVGSNIANILLIIGISAITAKKLVVDKSLIDLDLPLLAISTVLFLGVVWDKQVTFGESILMLITYIVYLFYTILSKDTDDEKAKRPKILVKDIVFLVLGVLGLIFGAKYLIEALIELSIILNVATGVISITALAIGTSLPELIVSVKAASQKKPEVALGNIFGSNVFNTLMITSVPGLFSVLAIDNQTFNIGIPIMALVTLLFVISGISKRIHMWEGAFYLLIYVLFLAKIFNWF